MLNLIFLLYSSISKSFKNTNQGVNDLLDNWYAKKMLYKTLMIQIMMLD